MWFAILFSCDVRIKVEATDAKDARRVAKVRFGQLFPHLEAKIKSVEEMQ